MTSVVLIMSCIAERKCLALVTSANLTMFEELRETAWGGSLVSVEVGGKK